MSAASEIVKDGEFGVKPGKKDGQLVEGEESRKTRIITDDKRTFHGLLDSFRKSRGVIAVMLMDRSGNIAKTNFTRTASSMYCALSSQILDNTISLIEGLDPLVKFRQLRSSAGVQELLIHPVVGGQLVFVVVQNCSDRASMAISCRPDEKKSQKKRGQSQSQANEASTHSGQLAVPSSSGGSTTKDKPRPT